MTRVATRTGDWRTAGLAAAMLVFSWPPLSLLERGVHPSYPLVTIVFATLMVAIVVTWDHTNNSPDSPDGSPSRRGRGMAGLVALAAAIVLVSSASRWVDQMVWNRHGADMLIVIREAARRFLQGHDPYFSYHTYDAPWDMVLPYGPVLWGPFVAPVLLRTDLRVITIAGELFVPVCCGITAIVEAARGRMVSAVTWIVLLAAIVASIDLANFTVMGHTPVYWPLLPVFAVVVTRGRWLTAALMLGILILARTTMVALVPLFVLAVWTDRRRVQDRMPAIMAVLAGTVIAGILPFALWDDHAIWDGMIASYPRIMKEVLWKSTDGGVINTIGVTGWLLSHQWERLVELTQVIAMTIACAAAWQPIRRGAAPLPWMALALLAFSMTTLWPVNYIYFDVLLLFVSAAIAETLGRPGSRALTRRLTPWLLTLAGVTFVVVAALRLTTSPLPAITAGSAAAHRSFKEGFSRVERDGGREFAWIAGDHATIVLPRSSAATADILVSCRQQGVEGGQTPIVMAVLNGRLLGTTRVGGGWDTLRFTAPRSTWWIGFNQLELRLSPAAEPRTFAVSDIGVVRRAK